MLKRRSAVFQTLDGQKAKRWLPSYDPSLLIQWLFEFNECTDVLCSSNNPNTILQVVLKV